MIAAVGLLEGCSPAGYSQANSDAFVERHNETKRLKLALAISTVYFFAELIAGFITNSLALLSDAGHINGLALWLIVGIILASAFNRLVAPPEVESTGMIVVAVLGLLVNIAAGVILFDPHQRHNLNLRGAFLHVVSDAVGSVGAIAAGVVMLTTGWYLADPLISILIGVLVLFSSWNLVKESLSILMQSVPKGIRLEEVQRTI